jgi:hypothetical protein
MVTNFRQLACMCALNVETQWSYRNGDHHGQGGILHLEVVYFLQLCFLKLLVTIEHLLSMQ